MAKYIKLAGVLLGIGAILLFLFLLKENRYLSKKWTTAEENIKTYSELLSKTDTKNRAYKLTIDQLNYFQDSVLQELNTARKELGIRDNKLKSLQYVASSFSTTDTILIKDTLFRDQVTNIDTTITNEWYTLNVNLQYPSIITITPSFKSKKYIAVSSRRETVNPPKKFFLLRWFQKKHTVLQVDIKESSPYIKNSDNRYIEILK